MKAKIVEPEETYVAREQDGSNTCPGVIYAVRATFLQQRVRTRQCKKCWGCVLYADRPRVYEGTLERLGSQSSINSWSWRLAAGSQFFSFRKHLKEVPALTQRSDYEVGVRYSPPCKGVSLEAEKRLPLEDATKQRDREH
jgi:hypothetical protein